MKLRAPRKAWTPAEDRILRRRYGKETAGRIAAALGRTRNSVLHRANALGLDAGRYATDEEIEVIREMHATHTAAEISEHLYGTTRRIKRVQNAAHRLGLRKMNSWSDSDIERVRALHAEGLTDAGIARAMPDVFGADGSGRRRACYIRRKLLNLPFNREAVNEAKREAIRKQFATLGLANPNDLRKRAHRRFAESYGLPSDLKPAQVRIILALLDGPKALAEIKSILGVSADSNLSLGRTSTSYTGDLVNRGLVAYVPSHLGHRRGRGPGLYLLTAACLDLLAGENCP